VIEAYVTSQKAIEEAPRLVEEHTTEWAASRIHGCAQDSIQHPHKRDKTFPLPFLGDDDDTRAAEITSAWFMGQENYLSKLGLAFTEI
jgi:hypothetical protein